METRNEARNRQRLTKKIYGWLTKYKPLFITLTFNDETLKGTTAEQRERLAIQYLKSETALYIANRDYGSKNSREHYHALIIASTLSYEETPAHLRRYRATLNAEPWKKYGLVKIDTTGAKYNAPMKTQAQNLAQHFKKESAKGERVIYSRGEPSKKQQIERLQITAESLAKAKAQRLAPYIEALKAKNPKLTDEEALEIIRNREQIKSLFKK